MENGINIFNYKKFSSMVYNGFRDNRVSFKDFLVIIKYFILFKIAGSYYIPRVSDQDKPRKRNSKKIIIKYLINFINSEIREGGYEMTPRVSKVTNTRVYFNYFTRSINDKDRLLKILFLQAMSVGGKQFGKSIKMNTQDGDTVRFFSQDDYGSSEMLFEFSLVALNKNNEEIKVTEIDIIEDLRDKRVLNNLRIEPRIILGLHVIDMNNRLKYRTKEDVLISRYLTFVKELSLLELYGGCKPNIDWDELVKPSFLNIIN